VRDTALNYPINIEYIFRSSHHNYFTRERYTPEHYVSESLDSVDLIPDKGIDGDRFEFSKYPITLFSLEVAKKIEQFHHGHIDIALYRRNIIISGINLNELIGESFRINDLLFEGISACYPCPWMNAMIGEGTYNQLKGCGGLRVRVLSAGRLELGRSEMMIDKRLQLKPAEVLEKRKLP
jgi:hypothetical protein